MAIFFVYLLLYNINSNLLVNGFGASGWLRNKTGPLNYGGPQLDAFLEKLTQREAIDRYDYYSWIKHGKKNLARWQGPAKPNGWKNIIILDGNIDWFSYVWLGERRRFYDNLALFSTDDTRWLGENEVWPTHYYFIKATPFASLDPIQFQDARPNNLEEHIQSLGFLPAFIRRDDGQIAYKIYDVSTSAFWSSNVTN